MPQKDFGSSAIESRLQTYTKNWYKEHVEWLNNPYTKPKTDPLGVWLRSIGEMVIMTGCLPVVTGSNPVWIAVVEADIG